MRKESREEISNVLDQDKVDELKEKFGLEEDDHTIFLRYKDQEGAEKTVHWAKLKGAVRPDPKDPKRLLSLEEDIALTKKELGL